MEFIFDINYMFLALYQLFAFFVQGLTGFGSTVLAAPFHSEVLGPTYGTAYATLLCFPTLSYVAWKNRHKVAWKDLVRILAVAIPGLLVGQSLLQYMDPKVAKLTIGIVVTCIALMNIYKTIIVPLVLKKEYVEDDEDGSLLKKIWRYVSLLLGGVLQGAFTSGGPFLSIYCLHAIKDKVNFRNTLAWVWVPLNLINSVKHASAGYFTAEMWSALALGLPFALIGTFIGMKYTEKVNKITFLRAVYVLLLIIGLTSVNANIGILFN